MIETIFATLALAISTVSLLASLNIIRFCKEVKEEIKNDPYEKYRNEHGLLTSKRQDLEPKKKVR